MRRFAIGPSLALLRSENLERGKIHCPDRRRASLQGGKGLQNQLILRLAVCNRVGSKRYLQKMLNLSIATRVPTGVWLSTISLTTAPSLRIHLREGCEKKKTGKNVVFCQTGGGSRMVVKCQTSILEKYFFS